MQNLRRYRELAIKRGLTPGAMLEACPEDLDLLLFALRREFAPARTYTEREVNEVIKHWLKIAGGMLDVDHVELRRWLIDLTILARDAYGQSYSLSGIPQRMRELDAAAAEIDFVREFAEANELEAQKRAARKAAWNQTKVPT